MKKWLFIVSGIMGLGIFAYAYAHNVSNTGEDPLYLNESLPKGAAGGIHFMGKGKGIQVLDNSGKKLKPVKEKRKGKIIAEATIRIKKINPCVFEWCPSDGVCEVYIIPEMADCSALF